MRKIRQETLERMWMQGNRRMEVPPEFKLTMGKNSKNFNYSGGVWMVLDYLFTKKEKKEMLQRWKNKEAPKGVEM